MKIQISSCLAWIAGIQVRRDASGDIHVSLDSSTPCWNDATAALLELTEVRPPIFSKVDKKITKFKITESEPFVSFVVKKGFRLPAPTMINDD